MTALWMMAAAVLLIALAITLVGLLSGPVPVRLAAIPIATTMTVLVLVAFDFAFDQPAAIDLAVALALLSLPGTLLFALVEERWL